MSIAGFAGIYSCHLKKIMNKTLFIWVVFDLCEFFSVTLVLFWADIFEESNEQKTHCSVVEYTLCTCKVQNPPLVLPVKKHLGNRFGTGVFGGQLPVSVQNAELNGLIIWLNFTCSVKCPVGYWHSPSQTHHVPNLGVCKPWSQMQRGLPDSGSHGTKSSRAIFLFWVNLHCKPRKWR